MTHNYPLPALGLGTADTDTQAVTPLAAITRITTAYGQAASTAQAGYQALLAARQAVYDKLSRDTGLLPRVIRYQYGGQVEGTYARQLIDLGDYLTAAARLYNQAIDAIDTWTTLGRRPAGFSIQGTLDQLAQIEHDSASTAAPYTSTTAGGTAALPDSHIRLTVGPAVDQLAARQACWARR